MVDSTSPSWTGPWRSGREDRKEGTDFPSLCRCLVRRWRICCQVRGYLGPLGQGPGPQIPPMPDVTKCYSAKVKKKRDLETWKRVWLSAIQSFSKPLPRSLHLKEDQQSALGLHTFQRLIWFAIYFLILLIPWVSTVNPYQVVEHHLVEGEHVAALRDGALEKEITSSPLEQVPPHLEESVSLWGEDVGVHTNRSWPGAKDRDSGRVASELGNAHLSFIFSSWSIAWNLTCSHRSASCWSLRPKLPAIEGFPGSAKNPREPSRYCATTKTTSCKIIKELKRTDDGKFKPGRGRTPGPNPLCWRHRRQSLPQESRPWQEGAACQVVLGCRCWEWGSPRNRGHLLPSRAGDTLVQRWWHHEHSPTVPGGQNCTKVDSVL